MNRQSEQLTKTHTSFDKSREKTQTPKVKCSTNKYLLNSSTKQSLNKSYNFNQKIYHKLQNKAASDIKQKLLDEILRGSHSQFSQSYLTSVIQDKMTKKQTKFHTNEDISSFTILEPNNKSPLQSMDEFVAEECMKQHIQTSSKQFLYMLEQLEFKEDELKINIFSNLKNAFINIAKQIDQKFQQKDTEIKKLQNEISQLHQQQIEMNKKMQDQYNKTLKTEETLNSLIFTLRYTNLNNQNQEMKRFDQVQTSKNQSEQKINTQEDNISMMSEDSAPFSKFYNYYIKKQQDPQNKKVLGLTLNLNSLKNPQTAPIEYHEEFMANFNEFSESWRQQVLKDKRY